MFGFSLLYQISNEQILIYRPSMLQLKHAFKPCPKISPPVEVIDIFFLNYDLFYGYVFIMF